MTVESLANMDVRLFGIFAGLCIGVCFAKKREFVYTIQNKLKEPFFEESVLFPIKCKDKPLIRYMEQSVLAYPDRFNNFTVTYMSPFGYFVNAINGRHAIYAGDRTYWAIVNQTTYLDRGVYSYIPKGGEQITFQLVEYDSTHQ